MENHGPSNASIIWQAIGVGAIVAGILGLVIAAVTNSPTIAGISIAIPVVYVVFNALGKALSRPAPLKVVEDVGRISSGFLWGIGIAAGIILLLIFAVLRTMADGFKF